MITLEGSSFLPFGAENFPPCSNEIGAARADGFPEKFDIEATKVVLIL